MLKFLKKIFSLGKSSVPPELPKSTTPKRPKKTPEELAKLPATKKLLAKMDEKGIEYAEGINRGNARSLLRKQELEQKERNSLEYLIKQHCEQSGEQSQAEERREMKEMRQSVIQDLEKRGFIFDPKSKTSILEELSWENPPTREAVERMNDWIQRCSQSGYQCPKIPKNLSAEIVEDFTFILKSARETAEYAKKELLSGSIDCWVGDDQALLTIKGIPRSADMSDFQAAIFKAALNEDFDLSVRIRSFIRKFFPEAKITTDKI